MMIRTIKKDTKAVLDAMENSPVFYIWISFLVALIFLAGYVLLMSLIFSMEILEVDITIPWGMLVSNYVFLVGSSVGLTMVLSLGYVFGLDRYKMIGRRGVFLALVTIILGLSSIGLHLGRPERGAIYNVLTPNIRSAMWWMGALYPPYVLFVAVWFWLLSRAELARRAAESVGVKAQINRLMALEGLRAFLYRRLPLKRMGLSLDSEDADLGWARIMASLALIFALSAYAIEGTLFAHTEARPLWYGAFYPIDFFLGASFCGFAWLMAVSIMTHKIKGEEIQAKLKELFTEMARILALLLSIGLLFTAYKMGHGLLEPGKAKTIMLFLHGPFSLAFWLFEIAIGLVLPIPILLYGASQKKMTGLLAASIMVLVGYFVKRYDFVVASQVYPLIKNGPPASYLPSIMEVLLIGGIIGVLLLVYTLGVRFLPLKEEGPQHAL